MIPYAPSPWLDDELARRVLAELGWGAATARELAGQCGSNLTAVSFRLRLLAAAGKVVREFEGRRAVYSLR